MNLEDDVKVFFRIASVDLHVNSYVYIESSLKTK